MPKLIDYPRTSYAGAWELAEVTDDTGGKCAIETAAKKLNRKVSGSFKAIIGSAVKFGLVTSKRDLLTTTTLFKRIKHAYDKQEELLFHREAFLNPPLFSQLCRKFRSRELPVQMLDVVLIREFGVEEINAAGVAKAFVEGCHMAKLLDERNTMADIDSLAARQGPRRELASPVPTVNTFKTEQSPTIFQVVTEANEDSPEIPDRREDAGLADSAAAKISPVYKPGTHHEPDAISSLFGLMSDPSSRIQPNVLLASTEPVLPPKPVTGSIQPPTATPFSKANSLMTNPPTEPALEPTNSLSYQLEMSGPGVNTQLTITDEQDVAIAMALLEKIRRQLRAQASS